MRKNAAPKRPVVKDPVYNSEQVSMLVNKILQDGKKSTAERIVYGALEACREKTGTDPVGTLEKALGNIRPDLEVRSRRVGGATYQVPVEVRPDRANTLALRWMVTFTRQRRENSMIERLANEILDASNGLGASVKRREDTHKMAEANPRLRPLPLVIFQPLHQWPKQREISFALNFGLPGGDLKLHISCLGHFGGTACDLGQLNWPSPA